MTRGKGEPKDPRSTYRKRGRQTLLKLVEEGLRDYRCAKCGYVPNTDWREKTRSGDFLDVNHRNRRWADNDPANLEFLCRTCHWHYDREEYQEEDLDDHGYGL